MSSKELKYMNQAELLELLIRLTKERDELLEQLMHKEEEIQQFRSRAYDAEKSTVQEPGSIAEEALRLNRIFEAAQQATNQYLSAIERIQREQELRCQKLIANAEAKADQILAEAEALASRMEPAFIPPRRASANSWNDFSGWLDQPELNAKGK